MGVDSLSPGQAIKQRRRELDLTQEVLAERAGCSVDTIRKLEAGSLRPSRQLAEILAARLEIPVPDRQAFVANVRSMANLGARAPVRADALPEESPNTNLPARATSLIGRVVERRAIRDLLLQKDVRLLNLTGAGGTGKTRLAIEVAESLLAEFPDGVFFVALAPLTNPALVLPAIARVLGVKEAAGQTLLEGVAEFVAGKQILLLLDNFEQVAAAAEVLADLLSAAARLKLLVTSREVLHVYGEHVFHVPPLALPDLKELPSLEALARNEAVALFVQRARAARPGFGLSGENAAAIAEVCARLDGLPLAIELAAARVRIFSPQQMLARLQSRLDWLTTAPTGAPRTLPERQQTLRATLDWSYNLLSPAEQRCLYHLSLFAGGCTIEAAAAVLGDRLPAEGDAGPGDRDERRAASGEHSALSTQYSVLDLLASLVDKSLLRQEEEEDAEPRFLMLETIREYGLERLSESGEEEHARLTHASYFLRLAQTASAHLLSAGRGAWLDRLEAEHENLRAALSWTLAAPGTAPLALQTAAALPWFWYFRGFPTEGQRWLRSALDAVPAGPGDNLLTARAEALAGAGFLSLVKDQIDAGVAQTQEAVAIFRRLGDKRGLAYSLAHLSTAFGDANEGAIAVAAAQESVSLFGELGDEWGLALALHFLSAATESVAITTGSLDAPVTRHLEESVALFRKLGDEWGVGMSLLALSWLDRRRGNTRRARAQLEESLAHFGEVRDRYGLVSSLLALAEMSRSQGDYAGASLRYEEALALSREMDYKPVIARVLHTLGYMRMRAGDYAAARSLCEESLSISRAEGLKETGAWALRNLGHLALLDGDRARARLLYAESFKLFQQVSGRMGMALCLADLIGARAAEDPAAAARMIGAADAVMDWYRMHLDDADRTGYERLVDEVRATLPQETFSSQRASGRAMSVDEALSEVLGGA